ncbi:hypothetical protein L7F22_039758 [Adiantum nelumboides]|nr:hypothetical protein [Adiantum nelumboides]
MRNPSITQQNPIFEPLFSQEEELHNAPLTHQVNHPSSSEWLSSSTYSASPCNGRAFPKNQLRKAPTTIFYQDMSSNQGGKGSELRCGPHPSERSELLVFDHGKPSPSNITDVLGRSMQSNTPPSRSLSLGDVNKDVDDGSVASKLLTSITKSMSSPSLLSCCKESVRETPYQKSLRLRIMKLQHCAEELGSESSDGALIYSDVGSFESPFKGSSQSSTANLFARSSPSTNSETDEMSEIDAAPMMISVRSAPNLKCPSLLSRSSSIKERSFPPPLITPSLSRSASSDSFAFSLRAYREDGRFMLKEEKVPCRQYLQASRKDGRLTLQLFTSDQTNEHDNSSDEGQKDVTNLQLDVHGVDVGEGDICASYSSDRKIGVESVDTIDVEGDLKLDNTNFHDILGMDETNGKLAFVSDVRKSGGHSAKSLLMATLNVANQEITDDLCHLGASHTKRNAANRKMVNRSSPSYLPNLYSTRHARKINPTMKVSGPLITFSQCEENMVLQSRSTLNTVNTRRVKSMLGLDICSASLQGTGCGSNRSLSSTIIFKDVGANALMENVSKLVSSFGIDGGKGFKNCQRRNSSTRYLDGIRLGLKKVEQSEAQAAHGFQFLNVECERRGPHASKDAPKGEGGSTWIDRNAGRVSAKSTTLKFDVHLPLRLENWLHNIHCKELYDRNNNFVHKGYPCVAIKS